MSDTMGQEMEQDLEKSGQAMKNIASNGINRAANHLKNKQSDKKSGEPATGGKPETPKKNAIGNMGNQAGNKLGQNINKTGNAAGGGMGKPDPMSMLGNGLQKAGKAKDDSVGEQTKEAIVDGAVSAGKAAVATGRLVASGGTDVGAWVDLIKNSKILKMNIKLIFLSHKKYPIGILPNRVFFSAIKPNTCIAASPYPAYLAGAPFSVCHCLPCVPINPSSQIHIPALIDSRIIICPP